MRSAPPAPAPAPAPAPPAPGSGALTTKRWGGRGLSTRGTTTEAPSAIPGSAAVGSGGCAGSSEGTRPGAAAAAAAAAGITQPASSTEGTWIGSY